MRGHILCIDEAGHGVISADDGQRYNFVPEELLGKGQPAREGMRVDFETQGNQAIRIYPDVLAQDQRGAKDKMVAGLLAIFMGGLGIHKFYLGYSGAGLIMLLCTVVGWVLIFPPMIVGIIAFIEGVIYLTRSNADFVQRYEVGRRPWF